jgi:hypothetical protein
VSRSHSSGLPPKKKKLLTTLGGSEIPLSMKKITFSFFFLPFLSVSACVRPRLFMGKRRWILKIREIFLLERDEEQNPLSVFVIELREGRIEAIFEAIFSRFPLFCYSPDLAGAVTANWRRIWKNQRRFLSST